MNIMDYSHGVIVILLIFIVYLIFTRCKSAFVGTSGETVYIFYAPWCGHCEKAMPEFIKVKENLPDIVNLVNSDVPENKELLKQYNIVGFPTIMKKPGKIYNGEREADKIIRWIMN